MMENVATSFGLAGDNAHQDKFAYVKRKESAARTYADGIGRMMEKGQLCTIFDADGKEYLDCLSCAGTLASGHNHPFILQRVREFLESGHVLQALDISTPVKHDFVVQLFASLPAAFAAQARVQFCGPSGADAVEAAVKLFKTATGRRSILAFHGAYHGMTSGALAMTGNLTAKQHVASIMPDVHFLPYPYSYRCPFGVGGAKSVELSLNYVERLLADPESGITKPAAIFLEAIQGEGGVVPADPAWLQGIRRITQRFDIPLVIDEIQTGFGRTGTMFAFESAGIVPDAVLVSKAIGGGFPLSLVLYHEKFDKWTPGAHAGTFRGNQIAMVAGAATLELITRDDLVSAAARKGSIIEHGLRQLAAEFDVIGDIRGRGLMWGIEIVDPAAEADQIGSFPGDGKMAGAIKRQCLDHGLLIETGGRHGAVLRLLPPLVISNNEVEGMLVKLRSAFVAATGRPAPPPPRLRDVRHADQ